MIGTFSKNKNENIFYGIVFLIIALLFLWLDFLSMYSICTGEHDTKELKEFEKGEKSFSITI